MPYGIGKLSRQVLLQAHRVYSIAPVLSIREGGIKRKNTSYKKGEEKGQVEQSNPNPKKVHFDIPPIDPIKAICFCFQQKGHKKYSCPKYLKDVKKNKANKIGTLNIFMVKLQSASTSYYWILDTRCGTHICFDVHGLKQSRKLWHGDLDLLMGIKSNIVVTRITNYKLVISTYLVVFQSICQIVAIRLIWKNIISFHALYHDGFQFLFYKSSIIVFKNDNLYFKAYP